MKQTCRNCHDCWFCNEFKEVMAKKVSIDEDMSDCLAWSPRERKK